MKKIFLSITMLYFLGTNLIFSQNCTEQEPTKLTEIHKMVSLNEEQSNRLKFIYEKYENMMDSAIFKVRDVQESSNLIYKAKKHFDINFMNILSYEQKREYIQNSALPEVANKTKGRIYYLKRTGNYTEEELEQFYDEIFNYLMLEKYVYVTERYNHVKQKENIAQLKKLEPQSLKTANGLQKAKHQGKTYQNGYKW